MKATMTDEGDLGDLTKSYQMKDEIFETDSLTFARQEVTEEEVIDDVLDNISRFRIGEREIRLDGVENNRDLIKGAVAKFKDEIYNGNIMPPAIAGHDDIIVEMALPETYSAMLSAQDEEFDEFWNYIQEGLEAGDRVSLVPPLKQVVEEFGEEDDIVQKFVLDDKQWLFFTGDFVELKPDAPITAVQFRDIDGETYNLEDLTFEYQSSDIQLGTASAHLCKSEGEIWGRADRDGVAELYPVAIHIAKGKHRTRHTKKLEPPEPE